MKRGKLRSAFLVLFILALCHSAALPQVVDTANGRPEFVRYLAEPSERRSTPPTWTDLVKVIEEQELLNTILDYGSTLKNAVTKDTLMPAEEETWFASLQKRGSEEDFKLALDRLSHDGNYKNRAVAAMILANFGHRDSAWHALARGLSDANEIVRVVCAELLLTLANYTPRGVDWSASASDINFLLSGTNLRAYPWVLDILIKTKVSPKLAEPLLHGDGSELLIAYLGASQARERSLAHKVLVRQPVRQAVD
jgi:hypothetical protein